MEEAGPGRPGLEDKKFIVVQDGAGEAAIAPLFQYPRRIGGDAQVGLEQVTAGGGRRPAQRSRDTAASAPISLYHHLAQFPVQVWRRWPGQVKQDKETFVLPASGCPWRRGESRSIRIGVFQARATGDAQRADGNSGLRIADCGFHSMVIK